MNKEVTKLKTNDDKLLFVGSDGFEEYYLNMKEDISKGWSFEGLRPETEEKLREQARESEPMDYMGMSRADFEAISNYFDYEKWADDMEQDWYDRYDVQAERENEDGETLYLGFGSGTNMKSYLEKHNINSYEDYQNHFEIIGLTENEYNDILKKI